MSSINLFSNSSILGIYRNSFAIILALIVFFMIGCNGEKEKKRPSFEATGIEVEITQSAGDLYKAIKFLPLPINIASFENIPTNELECWVLSERIKVNKNIEVDPVGMIHYDDGKLKKNIVLTIPSGSKFQTIKTKDILDFSTEHASIKSILESWLRSYKGNKSSAEVKWKNKQEALRYIRKYTELNDKK